MAKNSFLSEVQEFHNCIVQVIKKYQFRNRNEITCHGISVSQCYVLETLYTHGAITMKNLADQMHLAISTITRIVDQLEKKKYVERIQYSKDLRVKLLKLTPKGREIFLKSWSAVFESEKEIFKKIKPENRRVLIDLLKELNTSVDQWQTTCKLK